MTAYDRPAKPGSIVRITLIAAFLLLAPLGATGHAAAPGQRCEAGVASAVASCVSRVNALTRRCYGSTGAACLPGAAGVARALAGLDRTIVARCAPDATAQAAGSGAAVTTAALADRAREALRTDYCDRRGHPGIHFFLAASTTSIHTVLRTTRCSPGLRRRA